MLNKICVVVVALALAGAPISSLLATAPSGGGGEPVATPIRSNSLATSTSMPLTASCSDRCGVELPAWRAGLDQGSHDRRTD